MAQKALVSNIHRIIWSTFKKKLLQTNFSSDESFFENRMSLALAAKRAKSKNFGALSSFYLKEQDISGFRVPILVTPT